VKRSASDDVAPSARLAALPRALAEQLLQSLASSRTGSPRPRHGWGARLAAAWRARWTRRAVAALPFRCRTGPTLGRTTLPHVELQRRELRRPRRGRVVLQETGARTQQIEQQSRAGPFAGAKPESMMMPLRCEEVRPKAHPSRLEQARRFFPSWSCEFDSRHPLHRVSHSPSLLHRH
jgi:hypothetical protein